jgi:hypothetical protein
MAAPKQWTEVVRTSDPHVVLVSCNTLRQQYHKGNLTMLLKYMGCTIPINSEKLGLSTFYRGPLIRHVVMYVPEPSYINPITGKRDMNDFPNWAYVSIHAKWIGFDTDVDTNTDKQVCDSVTYIDEYSPHYTGRI